MDIEGESCVVLKICLRPTNALMERQNPQTLLASWNKKLCNFLIRNIAKFVLNKFLHMKLVSKEQSFSPSVIAQNSIL